MEEILVLIIQFILEALFNILTIFPWELPFYRGERAEDNNTILRCLYSFLFGLFLGFVSLLASHKSLISMSYLRIANLFISPFLAGWLSETIAKLVHRKKDDVWPKRHFWYAFWLCLGYVMVRFVGIHR